MRKPIIIFRFQNVKRSAPAVVLAVLLAGVHFSLRVRAQSPELTVQASFADKQAITPLEQIALSLNRSLEGAEGRLAVFIGLTEMTALFTATPNGLSYAPRSLPLPAGESPVTIYLVSPADAWKEIAQFTLRVSNKEPTGNVPAEAAQNASAQKTAENAGNKEPSRIARRLGLDKFAVTPSLTLGLESQPAAAHFPASTRPERPTFNDFSLQGTIQTEMARGPFNSQTNFDLVGTSFRGQALRFGELGKGAPHLDLTSYLMQFQLGKTKVALGHVPFGTNRFLIDNFFSRGITLSLPVNQRLDFALSALNGSTIVGWDNFFGLDRRKHQLISGTAGYEFLPARPGGLRFEVNLLHGSLLPLGNFNQGNITDAEQSKGFGFRLLASDKSQRFRADAGFARSRFNNPSDPSFNQGLTVAPARASTRSARYLEASYDLIHNRPLTENKQANLTLTFRHERVEPLFRSVATSTQANKYQNQIEVVGSIGEIMMTFSNFHFNDNLDNIPSMLKSFTRRQGLILGAPLVSLFGDPAKPAWWLPRLTYSFDRTHQFAKTLPSNADFQLEQLPNQLSTNHNFASEWQAGKWRLGYHVDDSFQANRSDREGMPVLSTLRNIAHGFSLGLNPTTSLDLGFDLSRENLQSRDSNADKDKERNDRALRYGINLNWRITKNSALAINLSDTLGRSLGALSLISNSRNTGYNVQWSYGFGREKSALQKVKGQFYIRYANQYARSLDHLFGINSLTRSQMVNVGLSVTLF